MKMKVNARPSSSPNSARTVNYDLFTQDETHAHNLVYKMNMMLNSPISYQ